MFVNLSYLKLLEISAETVAGFKLAVEEFFSSLRSIHGFNLVFFGCRIFQLFGMDSVLTE